MSGKTKEKESFRCGFVSIVGRPNVGKSTLLNYSLKEKVAIVSTIPQTTRNQIRGIYTEDRGQIIFVDTPGLHRPKDGLGKWMNKASEETLVDADCVIHLVDTSEPTGEEEDMVVTRLNNVKAPVIVGLNKIDLKGKYVPEYIALWEKTKNKPIGQIELFPKKIVPLIPCELRHNAAELPTDPLRGIWLLNNEIK